MTRPRPIALWFDKRHGSAHRSAPGQAKPAGVETRHGGPMAKKAIRGPRPKEPEQRLRGRRCIRQARGGVFKTMTASPNEHTNQADWAQQGRQRFEEGDLSGSR